MHVPDSEYSYKRRLRKWKAVTSRTSHMSTPSILTMNFFQALYRLETMLALADDTVRQHVFEELQEAEKEMHVQSAISRQLENELQDYMNRDRVNGCRSSLFFQMLPPEIRNEIYSYLVTSSTHSIHVFPPKGNECHGYRLSLCDESAYNWQHGHCQCENGRNFRPAPVQSPFFDNSLFLVSRLVRREALDAFFSQNVFTFTCLYELVRFTSTFKASSSKIQRIRLLERVDDYPASEHRVKNIAKARERLVSLKELTLHVYISVWSAYETLYEDGLINELMYFAFPSASARRGGLQKFEVNARQRAFHIISPATGDRSSDRLASISRRVEEKLTDVFMGTIVDEDTGERRRKYQKPEDVPMDAKPELKAREDEQPPTNRKGILFLRD